MNKLLILIFLLISFEAASKQGGNFFKTFSSVNGCSFNSIDTLHDGGYIMCGATFNQGCNFIILKVDSNGQEIWRYENAQFDGNIYGYLDNGLLKVKETFDYDIVAVGGISADSNYNFNALVVKLDSSGNLKWNKQFGFSNYDRFENLYLDNDSNIILLGLAYDQNLLIKIDNYGDSIWCTKGPTISNPVFFYPSQVIKIKNNYFVGGLTDSLVSNYGVLTLLKFDSLGNLLWRKDYIDTVSVYEDGSYWSLHDSLLLVNSYMKRGLSYYSRMSKIDFNGNLLETTFPSYYGKIDSDSTIINVNVDALQPDSILLGHFNFINGNNNWFFRFYIPGSNLGDVVSDKYGNLLMCGTQVLFGSVGYLAKANDTLSLSLDVFGDKLSVRIFPIPSSEFINVEFSTKDINKFREYSCEIIDLLGHRIYLNSVKSPEFKINVSTFKKGIYLFKINSNGVHISSGKIIIN